MRKRFGSMTWLVVVALVLTACSGFGGETSTELGEIDGNVSGGGDSVTSETIAASSDDQGLENQAPENPATGEQSDDERAPAPTGIVGNGGVGSVAAPIDLGRDIIFTATLTVAVDDVAAAGAAAGQAIQRLGGFLFGQDTVGGPAPQTVLVFKVFPQDFQAALEELGSIGDVRNQAVSADDVTERVVDLRSRIITAEASVERLRGFLDNADDLETIAALESQLLQRETDLETLRGQLRTVEDQVSLATITLTLTQARIAPAITVASTFYPGDDDAGFACPGTPSPAIEKGESVTACLVVSNTGDTPLVNIDVTDPVLGITLDDLTVVSGDPTAVLEPGAEITLSTVLTIEESLRTRTTAVATPANVDGTALDAQPVANTVSSTIRAQQPEGIAGFTDGLTASWSLLVDMVRLAVLAIGWLLPFSWVIALVWWLTRRRRDRTPPPPPAPQSSDEKPPALV